MDLDTRAQAGRLLGSFSRGELEGMAKTAGCVALAAAVVWVPGWLGLDWYEGLDRGGIAALGILVLAAALWVSEAMPAFAVALLVIGLEIAILGRPGGVWAEEGDAKAWTTFVEPWASPVMWLFLGGFVLAHGCSKTQLDRWLAGMVLGRFATSPARLLAAVMTITFVFSMFMSNTATAAMMVAVTAPVLAGLPKDSGLGRGLVVGVAAAANFGGIGTIIGTPPNAIAAGELGARMDFLGWMKVALPAALGLGLLAYLLVWSRWVRGERAEIPALGGEITSEPRQRRHRLVVLVVLVLTVALWMSESVVGIPSSVVSFIPIVGLAVFGVISAKDMRALPWDVLILLAGGLALGVAVEVTGLAQWFAGLVPGDLAPVAIAVVFCALGLALSNLMSNTAAAALLVPLAASLVEGESEVLVIVSIAVGCSAAMCLPISTPPNAIAFGTGRISSRDFLLPGLVAVAGMALVLPYLVLVL